MSIVAQRQAETEWFETNNSIITTVFSDGTSGMGWINKLDGMGIRVTNNARQFFYSKKFKISDDETDVEIIKGSVFKNKFDIIKMKRKAGYQALGKARPEVACLLQAKFSFEDFKAMNLKRVLIMHEAYDNMFLCLVINEGSAIIDMISMYETWESTDGFTFSFKK